MTNPAAIWKAKREGKLVVKNGRRINYGHKANREAVEWKAEHPDEPIPDLLVLDMSDEQWEAFAAQYQLEATAAE